MKRMTVLAITILLSLFMGQAGRASAQPERSNSDRTIRVEMTYVTADNYRNRLVNAEAAFRQLETFLDAVQWQPGKAYSFLKNVLGSTFNPKFGYVMTEKGYAYGACGATSLLNHLVQMITFRDSAGSEKPLFETIEVWTWTGDNTYGPYGATIYLDTTGTRRTKDYVWRLNADYKGTLPRITVDFDEATASAALTIVYSDNPA